MLVQEGTGAHVRPTPLLVAACLQCIVCVLQVLLERGDADKLKPVNAAPQEKVSCATPCVAHLHARMLMTKSAGPSPTYLELSAYAHQSVHEPQQALNSDGVPTFKYNGKDTPYYSEVGLLIAT